jgi:hypothetical protein
MNKYSLLIAVLSLFGAGYVSAQTDQDKEKPETDKKEVVKTEKKPDPAIKVVPASRDNKAKPAKVSSARPSNTKPRGNRPTRNPRPSGRPVRPGTGRN